MPSKTAFGLPLLLAASTSFALPRPNSHVRAGANHHLGDDSFVVKYGHNVDKRASETDRMHQHLQYVREWLASRPATKPELAAKRAEILAHFDAYIAKYTTPKNEHVPWRTPVFIDDEGTICAVGYLIQQTTNPQLPEKIAKAHRYDFIEDIAKDMPEVASWVEASGFTLDEIAHIQPAYSEPAARTWKTWDLAKHKPADGAYDQLDSRGTFKRGKMEGEWISYTKPYNSDEETITGRGTLKHGAGKWTAIYDDGKRFAEGRYENNVAQGPWKLYHHSGNLAAEGSFSGGTRTGAWSFYQDTPKQTPIAIGRFDGHGNVTGHWKHFDEQGALLATSWTETPDQWHDTDWAVDGGDGFMLDIVAKPGQVKHASHRGTVNSTPMSLDMYALGGERIYVHNLYDHETTYDQDGWKLVKGDDGKWTAADCGWSAKKKLYAHGGDLVPLHGALYSATRLRVKPAYEGVGGGATDETGPTCKAPVAVGAKRAEKLDALVAAKQKVRSLTPQFVRAEVLAEEGSSDADADADADTSDVIPEGDQHERARFKDMTQVLEANMSMYLEWPHIDGKFVDLFHRMPGRKTWNWAGGDPERDESDKG